MAYVTKEDIERWKREKREDIFNVIKHYKAVWVGDHFISSANGHFLHGCPFLEWEERHYTCSIYETRPLVCRKYKPGSSEICSMFYEKKLAVNAGR